MTHFFEVGPIFTRGSLCSIFLYRKERIFGQFAELPRRGHDMLDLYIIIAASSAGYTARESHCKVVGKL
ncbi:hypothetical protein RYX36_031149, partial [Vicia faba]